MLTIFIKRPYRYPADSKRIIEAVRKILSQKGVSEGEVSIAIVGERKMKELAAQYLGESSNVPTHEVLAFPFSDPAQSGVTFILPEERPLPLGDIVLCYPVAREIAMEEDRMVDDILLELAEHGALHLIGVYHSQE